MHFVSRTVWSLVGALACLGAVANAAGVLDMGVVFPRQNETYAPMERFPFVFALQNAQLAEHLNPLITFDVLNGSHDIINGREFDLEWANYTNYTTEPYLLYAFMDFNTEGPLTLRLDAGWRQCDMSGEEVRSGNNKSRLWVDFNIRDGAQKADLVTATAEEEECPAQVGVAINVTDETHDVLFRNRGNCSVVDYSSPSPVSNPCRVRIDKAAVESAEAKELDRRCRRLNPPADCPEEGHALQQLAVAGGATFAAVLSAITFLLA
ncbi:hypothetical protein F5883DRAFT_713367 [Diaporthe sp. PMI_573]|nr:hypothetical protein F5883DRAFT_713367 [Diaporthaceae sp. PMI_573]